MSARTEFPFERGLNYLRILFVCTGNTCRSPMAEAIFRDLASQHFKCAPEKLWDHDLDVLSAGVAAGDSHPASSNAVTVLKARGVDLSQHLSQQLTEKMLEGSDLILTMTNNHLSIVQNARPDLATKMRLLSETGSNIIDPIGGSLEDYDQCANMITEWLTSLLDQIIKKDARSKMRIGIASDHRGFEMKNRLARLIESLGHEVEDCGPHSTESVDYPDYAFEVSNSVALDKIDRGVLICGTGIGMCIAANKVSGVRAANCNDSVTAEYSRLHNDANVVCLSADQLSDQLADQIVEIWLKTEFEHGRHARRLEKSLTLKTSFRPKPLLNKLDQCPLNQLTAKSLLTPHQQPVRRTCGLMKSCLRR